MIVVFPPAIHRTQLNGLMDDEGTRGFQLHCSVSVFFFTTCNHGLIQVFCVCIPISNDFVKINITLKSVSDKRLFLLLRRDTSTSAFEIEIIVRAGSYSMVFVL